MTATKLKRSLGTDGQALTDESYGADGLKAVLQAVAKTAGLRLSGFQATITIATLDEMLVQSAQDYLLRLDLRVAVCGTAGDTVIQVQRNGTLIPNATLTIANTATDPTLSETAEIAVSLAENDRITLAVTTAPTGGTGLTATAQFYALDIE